jgi:hypothetical protein
MRNSPFEIAGKAAIVTGGAMGIGFGGSVGLSRRAQMF